MPHQALKGLNQIKQEFSWEIYENLDENKEKVRAFIEKFSLLTIASISGWDYIRSAVANLAVFWRNCRRVC